MTDEHKDQQEPEVETLKVTIVDANGGVSTENLTSAELANLQAQQHGIIVITIHGTSN